jgi:hypothetical protein
MPVLRDMLRPEGALVEVSVGWSKGASQNQRMALRPVPSPITVRALLDSGAEMTCVDASIIRKLGLPFGGTVFANLPAHGGFSVQSVHDASLTILHPSGKAQDNWALPDLSVLDLSLASLGYEALIGRDILNRSRFLYHGIANRFRLSY